MALLGSTATIISSESTDAFDLSGASDLVTDSQGGLYVRARHACMQVDTEGYCCRITLDGGGLRRPGRGKDYCNILNP